MQSLYTKAGYKVSLQLVNPGIPLHWLFLPGGPGLGSESFSDLGIKLNLPGNVWYVDYPNDGSNQRSQEKNFKLWRDGLIELLESFDNVVLVAHSFSGMFVLSDQRVESNIQGLVLLNTAPNSKWMQEISKQAKQHQLPDISKIQKKYQENANNDLFKQLTLACAPYFFSKASLEQGQRLLASLPYSHASYDWAGKFFHPHYEAAFVPHNIPTLIVGSEYDHITPLDLFIEDARWHRNNITIECLKGEGHFSWISGVGSLKDYFERMIENLDLKSNTVNQEKENG